MAAANAALATIAVLESSIRIVDEIGAVPMMGGELHAAQVDVMPARCIVVALAGRGVSIGTRDHLPVSKPRVDVRCYGRTRNEADTLALVASLALKAWRRAVVGGRYFVYSFEPSSGPVPTRDPDGDWPVTIVSFEVLLGDDTAE